MAVPIGTTGRQLAALFRAVFAAVVVICLLGWWWPDYTSWAGLTLGLATAWTIWLLWQIARGNRQVPGNPLHLALWGLAGLLTWHVARQQLTGGVEQSSYVLRGQLELSMIFHLAMLSLTALLSQSMLLGLASDRARRAWMQVIAAAILLGAGLAGAVSAEPVIRSAILLTGWAGVLVWFAPLWPLEMRLSPRGDPLRGLQIGAQVAWVLSGLLAIIAMMVIDPPTGALALITAGAVAIFAGLLTRRTRWGMLAGGAVVAGAGLAIGQLAGLPVPMAGAVDAGALGRGSMAMDTLCARDNGLSLLGAITGEAGIGWLALTGVAAIVLSLAKGRRATTALRLRTALWTSAAVMAVWAVLAPGGLFLPATTVALAVLWGLMPEVSGHRVVTRTGAVVLLPVLLLAVLLGVSSTGSLAGYMAERLGAGDKAMHAVIGFLLAMVLAWLGGTRSTWLGLGAIVLAIGAGGLGEVVQRLATTRSFEFNDWIAHALGSAVVLPVYLLCRGARWSESPDAVLRDAADPYSHTNGWTPDGPA